MAVFSTNQVRQLYVAVADTTGIVDESDAVGTISVGEASDSVYFSYRGVGGVTRSDLIKKDNILSYKKTTAASMARSLSRYKVVADPALHATGAVAGQDYILRIAFRNYIGLSDSDQYFKYGMVHATSGMTLSDLYRDMALSLVKNFSNAESGLLKFYLEIGGTATASADGLAAADWGTLTAVTKSDSKDTLSGTYTGIVVEELEQEWKLGVMESAPVNFTILPTLITVSADDRIWGLVSKNNPNASNAVGNGKLIADLEYFCMGERGDQYRNIGWPHVITTKYLVDPTSTYDVIDIHYAFIGSGENPQKSEKTITIVGDTSTIGDVYTAFTALL